MLIIILLIASGIVPHALDIYSSAINNPFCLRVNPPRIIEGRKMFRLPDGRCDIHKLILFKVALFVICACLAFGLYIWTDAGLIAFGVMPLMGAIAITTVLKNFKLNRKYRKLSQEENRQ